MGNDYVVNDLGNPEVVYDPSINKRLQSAPYFKHFTEAQNQAVKKDSTPYVKTYIADRDRGIAGIAPIVAPQVAKVVAPVTVQEAKTSKKRIVLIILVTLLALVSVGIPFVSSFGILSDYIDIGEDILTVDTLVSETPTMDSITASIPLILLVLFTLFMAIVLLLSIISIFSCKKIGIGLLAFIAFVLGVGYLITALPDLVTYFDTDGLFDEYGKIAMIALPLLIFIISKLRYKKQ